MKKILNKILDEINKEVPRLDYIRGLIEASLEEEKIAPEIVNTFIPIVPRSIGKIPEVVPMDEASIMEAETKTFIAKNGMPKMETE